MIKFNIKLIQPDYINEQDNIIIDGEYDEVSVHNHIVGNLFDQYAYSFGNKVKARKKLQSDLLLFKVKSDIGTHPLNALNIKDALINNNEFIIIKNNIVIYRIEFKNENTKGN